MKKIHLVLFLLGGALLAPQLTLRASCDPQPRGVRLAVISYFLVTNSEDGVGDNSVETYGYLNINDQTIWTVKKQNRIGGMKRGSRIDAGTYYCEVMFDKPAGWMLKLNGYVNDYDASSNDDGMWNPLNIPTFVNIKEMYENRRLGKKAVVTVRGDRDSESADLVLELGSIRTIY